jgi:hypothetical protein
MAVEPTWYGRDLPVLAATVSLLSEPGHAPAVQVWQIAERVKWEPQDVFEALVALKDDYVVLQGAIRPGPGAVMVVGVTSEARRAVGQWPTPENISARLLAALQEAADRESDPAQKSRLRTAAEAVAGIGRGVLVEVVAKVITAHI